MFAKHRVGRSLSRTAPSVLDRGRQQHQQHRQLFSSLLGIWLTVSLVAATLIVVTDRQPEPITSRAGAIGGPYAQLLASSIDLGPSRSGHTQLTAALRGTARPEPLIRWAAGNGLSVRWRTGEDWAIVHGAPSKVAAAFNLPVNDYRGEHGQDFYASPRQAEVPAPLRATVDAFGRILSYTPHHQSRPELIPLDIPTKGLTPNLLLTAYNAAPLAAAGIRGQGQTIVFYSFDGYDQDDLDHFAQSSGLPPLKPILIGGQPGEPHGEIVQDLEVAHAIAPDARLVVINARPTLVTDGPYERIGELFDSVDQQFRGAVWSLSIGWGCDALITAADLKPVQSALLRAQSHGTTIFDASGDTAGLECKGGKNYSSPPGPDDVGLDAVSSLPSVTSVGGTTLSTDADGNWLAEQAWVDSPQSLGTSGGVSRLFPRPAWQRDVYAKRDPEGLHRLTPDVSAVADPFTGVRIRFDGQDLIGAGTSQSAPIWAALTVLMNQYLIAHGGHALGDLNPLLYRVAAGANAPAFRDVNLGANAVDLAASGYDLVTGLGSPNVDALVHDLLDIQRGVSPR
jgi:kumamolisin